MMFSQIDQDQYVFIVVHDGAMRLDNARVDNATMDYLSTFERKDEWTFVAMVF